MTLGMTLAMGFLGMVVAAGWVRPGSPAVLRHDAYVWQRLWPTELSQAVADAPTAVGTLHVLAREWGERPGRRPARSWM
jgi:hypothetical protein